ncbi:hypothetical protein L1887_12197 [Cichorium endivia]|nr:hypothetical protein L1887_12197 [Cichorium endivia]
MGLYRASLISLHGLLLFNTKKTCPVALNGGDGGLRNWDKGFLRGEKTRGSLNGTVWVNHLHKKLSLQKRHSKITKRGVAYSVITSDNGKETMVETLTAPIFERRRVNPKNVAEIILGGGAGTQLFPLTSKIATPAELAMEATRNDGRLARIPLKNRAKEAEAHQFLLLRFNQIIENYNASLECQGRMQLARELLTGERRILESTSSWLKKYCQTLKDL